MTHVTKISSCIKKTMSITMINSLPSVKLRLGTVENDEYCMHV